MIKSLHNAAIFSLGALSFASVALIIKYLKSKHKTASLFDDSSPSDDMPDPFGQPIEDPEVVQEQLTRNYSFFGPESMENMREAQVVVVGLGGVGSHAAIHLLRSGVKYIRVIDFDQVTLSSLNRHAVATRADVGLSKAWVLKRHAKNIFPNAEIDSRIELFELEKADKLILIGNEKPSFVLDCIDNIDTKVHLLRYCMENGIKVMSSMGSACKADPSRIQITKLYQTSEDKLARAVRQKLKREHRIERPNIPVVYSTEKPQVNIMSLPDEATDAKDIKEYASLPNFRVRILPVISPIPAMFGAAMAGWVLCDLGNFPIQPLATKYRNEKFYKKLLKEFIQHEQSAHQNEQVSQVIDVFDIEEVVEDLWKARSCISGSTERLVIRIWNREQPLKKQNLVLLTKEEAESHDVKSLNEYGNLRNDIEADIQEFYHYSS